MLTLHIDIVRNIKIPVPTSEGVDAFRIYVEKFHERLRPILTYDHTKAKNYSDGYGAHFDEYGSYFSQYLKSLHAVYQFVRSNNLIENSEKRYLEILKAYITLYEKKFLFYHLTLISDEKDRRELKQMESHLGLIRDLSGRDLNENESHLQLLVPYNIKYPVGTPTRSGKHNKQKN